MSNLPDHRRPPSTPKQVRLTDWAKASTAAGAELMGLSALKALAGPMVEKRKYDYFEALCEKVHTETQLFDDEKTHAVMCTLHAATRARTRDKVNRFANIAAGYLNGDQQSIDDCERHTNILDDLSDLEFLVLTLVRHWQGPPAPRNNYQAKEYWASLRRQVIAAGVPEPELFSFFARLQRTGFYRMYADISAPSDWPEIGETTAGLDVFMRACGLPVPAERQTDWLSGSSTLLVANEADTTSITLAIEGLFAFPATLKPAAISQTRPGKGAPARTVYQILMWLPVQLKPLTPEEEAALNELKSHPPILVTSGARKVRAFLKQDERSGAWQIGVVAEV